MKMRMQTFLLAMVFAALASPCCAGEQSGVIAAIIKRSSDGLVYFYLSGAAVGKPSCATQSYWMIKDENSNTGKQQLAMLLMARATGQTISVSGSNACTRWGDGEDLDAIAL